MSDYQLNIAALNAICRRLGGAGGHLLNIGALNEWATLAGGAGGHASSVAALNEVATCLGGAGGHAFNIGALNEIAALMGGVGGHTMHVGALSEIASRLAAPPPPAAPANLAPPTIDGPARVGATLTAADGTWSGSPALAGQWQRDGVDIAGETGGAYTLAAGDDGAEVRRRVTATNAQGSATAFSAAVAVTYPVPVAGGLADQSFALGSGLRHYDAGAAFADAVGGGWSLPGAPAGLAVEGGVMAIDTGATGALSGHAVTVRYANSGGVAEAGFALTVAAAGVAPACVEAPAIAGPARVGVPLAVASDGGWTGTPAPTLARNWQLDAADLPGATGTSLVPGAADIGRSVRLRVTATNSAGSATAHSAAATVGIEPPAFQGGLAAPGLETVGSPMAGFAFAPAFTDPAGIGVWSLTERPAWMSIDAGGTLAGTPAAAGDVPVTARLSNPGGFAEASVTVPVVPRLLGTTGFFHDVGGSASNVALAWSAWDTPPVAGDLAVLLQTNLGSASPAYPSDGASAFAPVGPAIARIDWDVGCNYAMVIASKALSAADVAAGQVVLPSVGSRCGAVLAVFRGAATATRAPDFARSAHLAANALALPAMTAPSAGLLLAYGARGGGLRAPSIPGWTVQRVAQSVGSGGARYSALAATRPTTAGAVPAATWSESGAADMTMTAAVMLIA